MHIGVVRPDRRIGPQSRRGRGIEEGTRPLRREVRERRPDLPIGIRGIGAAGVHGLARQPAHVGREQARLRAHQCLVIPCAAALPLVGCAPVEGREGSGVTPEDLAVQCGRDILDVGGRQDQDRRAAQRREAFD